MNASVTIKSVNQNILSKSITFIFIFLLTYTGFSKLLAHQQFMEVLIRIPGLKNIGGIISYALPVAEITIAALLLLQNTKIGAWYAAAILMTVFSVYVGVMLLSGSRLPCTCGGVITAMTWKQHLLFNVAFTALAWFQLAKEKNHNRTS